MAVVAGRGNNGGDGFVVARYLANAGIPVAVFLLGPRDQVSGDARVNLDILAHLGIAVAEVLTEADLNPAIHRLAKAGLIVDALLGTGLNAPVQGLMAALIERLNHLRAQVLAVDIPTGLSADTGEVLGVALKAGVTVTYGWPKLGQVLPPGRDYVGRLWQVDIGIPPISPGRCRFPWPKPGKCGPCCRPGLSAATRGTSATCWSWPGSVGKTGAAALAAEAALRAGAGLVTLGVPASLNDILEVKLTEAMTLPLPEAAAARALGRAAWAPIVEFLTAANSPWPWGRGSAPTRRPGSWWAGWCVTCRPMVIDADGLNNLAGDTAGLKDAAAPRILTPHPGEMARLVGLTTPEVQARRLDLARETAAKFGVTLVLKGAQTVVAAPDGRASLNSTGNPALASGGTGDVLTGLIGGFLAQGLAPWDAARLGVYLHGLAADYFVSRHGPRGMIAGDLLSVLPDMLAEFSQGMIPPAEGDICFTRVIS